MFSLDLVHDAVTQVMLVRNRQLEADGMDPTPGVFMPFASQKKVQLRIFHYWSQLPESVERHHYWLGRGKNADQLARQMRSYHSKWMKEVFGGREWYMILIAIGTIDQDILDCVNNEI